MLDAAGVAISMDGKGRWIDNVFIERLWRSVKYEEVYLHGYANGTEARTSLTCYFTLRDDLTRPSSIAPQTRFISVHWLKPSRRPPEEQS